jgi:spore maturation protein CgeB
MKLFVFGSSITSSYWNGAATYYRGIYKNLHRLGHEIVFAEPDIYGRQQKRDVVEIDYAKVRVYQTPAELDAVLQEADTAELVIKHSGVGADDEFLESAVLSLRTSWRKIAFWDVDAPATLARVRENPNDPFCKLIPEFDFIFTYGGGVPVIEHYLALGAKNCTPIYNGLDQETHHPVPPSSELSCDLAFVGHRLPDREKRVEQYFLTAAESAPDLHFILGGEGWGSRRLPKNVRWIGHVATPKHNLVNCSARMVLNINRDSMAELGFSPPTRVFEAAGSGACLITDSWPGIEQFFVPGGEILVAESADDVVYHLRNTAVAQGAKIGAAMRDRAVREHSYQSRVQALDRILRSGKKNFTEVEAAA